ncbi:MAG TPA: CPBP family glutamic-type intramembrane protease [Rhizomicrobium sp.]|nr:CPBP family glutamic-type intramembrane protease [Rhizomicrobium sp.]
MDATTSPVSRRSPWRFFVLAFLLAFPFWILGAQSGGMLLPGLPIAALMAICPGLAALLLVYREEGGVRAFLSGSLGVARPRRWLVVALLLSLAVGAVTFAVLHAAQGANFTVVPPFKFAAMAAAFLVAAWCEELGWSGYATDPLQARWGTLAAALVIGMVWAGWHFVPLVQAGHDTLWIAWWTLGTIATRFVIVSLYNASGGSVLAATLFHATNNLCVFAMTGTYDVRVSALAVTALAAWFVVFGTGNRSYGGIRS